MLDLQSEVNQRPGFNTQWGKHFGTGFFCFHHSKASDANIDIIANFESFEKSIRTALSHTPDGLLVNIDVVSFVIYSVKNLVLGLRNYFDIPVPFLIAFS